MFSDTLSVESLRITPHSNHQFIPTHIKHLPLLSFLPNISHPSISRQRNALHRIIDRFFDAQRPLVEINAIRPTLEELRTLLLAFPRTGRF